MAWTSVATRPILVASLFAIAVGPVAGRTVAAPPRRAAAPYCVVSQTWMLQGQDLERSLAMMTAAGVRWMRIDFHWKEIEPRRGAYSFLKYERLITRAAAHGIGIIATIVQYDGPPWARGGSEWSLPPTRMSDFRTYTWRLAARFRGRIPYYEIGNEPNSSKYWYRGPSVDGYLALLRAGYQGVKTGDPAARVISAGAAPWGPRFIDPLTWARRLYAKGAARYFDALGAHPGSTPRSPDSDRSRFARMSLVRDLRRIMVASGDEATPLVVTEFGWTTARISTGVSEAAQAKYVARAFAKIRSEYPYVPLACVFTFRDVGRNPREHEDNFGLITYTFRPKAAYYAFRGVALASADPRRAARFP